MGVVGGWTGWLTAGSLRGLCQLMSIPSPGRKGEVIYILQEEGAAAVPLCPEDLKGRGTGQRGGHTVGLLFSQSDCSIGSRSPGGALLPCWPDCWGDSPPLFVFFPPSPPALTSWGGSWTTIRPKCQDTRPPAGILVAAGCICALLGYFLLPTRSLPPTSSYLPIWGISWAP